MITSFELYTNLKSECDPGGVINNGCGSSTVGKWCAPGLPTKASSSFESEVKKSYLYDPSKGRSFRKLKQSGAIAMSEYTRGVETTTRMLSSIDRKFTHASYTSTGKCGKTQACATYGPNPVSASWTENYHIGMLSHLPIFGKSINDYRSEVPDLVSSTQQEAFSKALNSYDLLTEIGEAGETLRYLMGKVHGVTGLMNKLRSHDPDAYNQGRRSTAKTLLRSSDKSLRKLGARWMEYRYALMPLFYSVKDIQGLLDSHGAKYHTERSKDIITCNDSPFAFGDEYLLNSVSGSIEVRSLTKASYDLGSLQRLASVVGLNPFRTAWELVPLSFVVDWGLNVGDAITSLTGLDYSSQRNGCTTVRSKIRGEVVHHRKVNDIVYWEWNKNACGFAPPPWNRVFNVTYNNLLEVTEIDSYVRTLWSRPEPKVVFNPSLSWKRIVDSLVLGYQPTRKLLRSL